MYCNRNNNPVDDLLVPQVRPWAELNNIVVEECIGIKHNGITSLFWNRLPE